MRSRAALKQLNQKLNQQLKQKLNQKLNQRVNQRVRLREMQKEMVRTVGKMKKSVRKSRKAMEEMTLKASWTQAQRNASQRQREPFTRSVSALDSVSLSGARLEVMLTSES